MARSSTDHTLVAQLKASPEYKHALTAAAEKVRRTATVFEQAARGPWMPPRANRGRTIVVRTQGDNVRVVNIDHAGHLIEWGSINNPPHAPLRRAVLAEGFRFVETPKHQG